MTVKEILAQLKTLGNEQVSLRNAKNGAGDNQFGVKMGDIRTLAKKIKTNHELAKSLWETENLEARLLATLIIIPQNLSSTEIETMVSAATFSWLADWLNAYVVKEHPDKEALRQKWMFSNDIMVARAGWNLTAARVVRNPDGLDLPGILDRIESEMPNAAPEVQWTMNSTLAQIGICHSQYRQRALTIGETLGIYRDYPVSKGCTSPFAPIWINEMVSRQKT
ncbi:DNA alkylation repair protein [Pedobacter punctiformis]|uniref:DNA alkylation repair protein n=1 Tax=Pedobacter punctiformis TaxID=3004097 RepID=A0ABT4LDB4_9SPHI|nr:DNA alkylation repair protein [Pedobacter sp. HCMS5-2]MCZ4245917.1 DNA alkylation repair protein [Pedobacter sp. HCMS5-2]